MGRRRTSPAPRAARVTDPLHQVNRAAWEIHRRRTEDEARQRSEHRAALERDLILVVGRPIRGDDGRSPVRPTALDPVEDLYRRGQLAPVPEHFFSNVVGIYDEEEPPPQASAPAPVWSPSPPSEQDLERTLAALVRRAEQSREQDRRRPAPPRTYPDRDPAQEQERQRRLREVYEARRPTTAYPREAPLRPAPLPAARQVSRPTAPPRARASLPPREAPSRAELEQDVDAIAARRRGSAAREPARRAVAETGTAHGGPSIPPELQRDVLRELNHKYATHFQEPWQMLAHLRRGADRLRASRGSSSEIQGLASDHGRLRRALDEL